MRLSSRSALSVLAVLGLLAGLALVTVDAGVAGAVGTPYGAITFADGTTSANGVNPGDEIGIDLTVGNCADSTVGSFTLQMASEYYTTFPVGPSWTNGTTYGPTWPKVTDGTGLTDGVYRLYFTVPDLGPGQHSISLGWLQGINCFAGGGWTNWISFTDAPPAPPSTTTTTVAPEATPSASMTPDPATTADTLTFHLTVAGNQATPTGSAGVGFYAPGDPSMQFNTGCSLTGGECDATIAASTVAGLIGNSFDVRPFYNGDGVYGSSNGLTSSYALSLPPTTTVPPTTVPPTTVPPTTVPPTTPPTTVRPPRRQVPRPPSTTVPPTTMPPTTMAPRPAPACPARRPYRIYSDLRSRSIGAALVANCRYRSEWRRLFGQRVQFVVPAGWSEDRRIPSQWWD